MAPSAQNFIQQHRVAYGPRQRPGMIQRRAQRHDSVYRHGAERRFESHHAAQRRGNPDRASRIRPHRRRAQTRGHRNRAPAARPSRDSLQVAWIVRRAEMDVVARHSVSEFVQVRFPQHDGARRAQPCHNLRIAVRHELRQDLRPGGRPHTFRPDVVLQRDGNAMERSPPASARDFPLRPLRLRQRRLPHHRQVGIQPRIQPFDPLEIRAHQVDRRELPRAHEFGQLRDGQEWQFLRGTCRGRPTRGRRQRAHQ